MLKNLELSALALKKALEESIEQPTKVMSRDEICAEILKNGFACAYTKKVPSKRGRPPKNKV
jgi:hypothetical protein